jgi:hypothetical protein
MLDLKKQQPQRYKISDKWVVASAFFTGMVYAVVFVVIWPLLVKQNRHAELLSRAKYGFLTGPKLSVYTAAYSNETHSVAPFSANAVGNCMGMSAIHLANGIDGFDSHKHYYAMGEDNQWVEIFLCSDVSIEGATSSL